MVRWIAYTYAVMIVLDFDGAAIVIGVVVIGKGGGM